MFVSELSFLYRVKNLGSVLPYYLRVNTFWTVYLRVKIDSSMNLPCSSMILESWSNIVGFA